MKLNNSLRVVIDTNIWISFLIGKHLSQLKEPLINGKVTILFSEELFEEVLAVLQRPKFRKYFSSEAIRELITLLSVKIEWVEVTESL